MGGEGEVRRFTGAGDYIVYGGGGCKCSGGELSIMT